MHNHNHTQSPFHKSRLVPHEKKKTAFNCWIGYHSVSLHLDNPHFSTFITPWRRGTDTRHLEYIWSRDGYTRRFDEIIAHTMMN